MTETELDTPSATSKQDAEKPITPWESMDPDEPAPAEEAAGPAAQSPVTYREIAGTAQPPKKASPFASTAITAVGADMEALASEIQSLLAEERFTSSDGRITAPNASDDHLLARALLSDDKVQFENELPALTGEADAPAAPDAILESPPSSEVDAYTPWATMDSASVVDDEGPSPVAEASVVADEAVDAPEIDEDAGYEPQAGAADVEAVDPFGAEISPVPDLSLSNAEAEPPVPSDTVSNIEVASDPGLEESAFAEIDSSATAESVSEASAVETSESPVIAAQNIAITFATTEPVIAGAALIDPAQSFEEDEAENAADATVLVPLEPEENDSFSLTTPQLVLHPRLEAEVEPELQSEAASPVTTGGAWTIPLMCMGIGLIACCMAIPQIDFNRRLRYEQNILSSNLHYVQKQVAVNGEFLKKVADDPTLAERLAARQMKTMRKGQQVLELKSEPKDSDMSPFALVAVAPPPAPPAYKPIKGTIANICYDGRSRLYLLGVALTMVAAGLVMGFSPTRS